ncbi:hypothetical protein AVEN_64494-1 [Araneus ventricosus]|uniref:Uncharacterized protein n=1 Tax=Araneus ventricosus TaxID=182803 RepID=A0A4Y2IQP8_ARAVE|nr:hypothetical protein AVEN_64494-1 [Araneus ventricosus]
MVEVGTFGIGVSPHLYQCRLHFGFNLKWHYTFYELENHRWDGVVRPCDVEQKLPLYRGQEFLLSGYNVVGRCCMRSIQMKRNGIENKIKDDH